MAAARYRRAVGHGAQFSSRPRDARGSTERAPVLALVVVAILARADRLPPPGVVAVPVDRPREARVEAGQGLPAQCAHLLRGQRVAPVVARTVGDQVDERIVPLAQREDAAHDLEVGLLVGAAGVVGLAGTPMLEDVADGACEVLDED